MKKVTGIGGILFTCKDPNQLKQWYAKHLGMPTDDYGVNFVWRKDDKPEERGCTQWSAMPEGSAYMQPSTAPFMINYRVENLDAIVADLKREGVTVLDEIEVTDYGKFVHILDGEGHKVELWEPIDSEYEKLLDAQIPSE